MHQGKKHNYMKFYVTMLIILSMAASIGKLTGTTVKAEEGVGDAIAVTPLPTPEESPLPTSDPEETQEPTATPRPTAKPTVTPKPTAKPKPLKRVSGVKLVRYSTKAVKVTWKKVSKANYYKVYYSQTKNGKYKLSGVTKNRQLLVTKLKDKKKYYIYVQACEKKNKESAKDSAPSKKVHMTMQKYQRKIIFAGDSVCQGIGIYGRTYPAMHSSARKKVVAYKGLNTITFRTKRVFNGMTGIQKVISEKPYRVYMMLGINEVHYRPVSQMIADYTTLINSIQKSSPNTDIVLCAVSPVTRAEQARHPGMKQIPAFNSQLKKLAKKLGLKYLDYTAFLKDSGGFLKSSYATGDGYHWQPSAYAKFGEVVGEYDKSLDK